MAQREHSSLIWLIARYYSPFALPHPAPETNPGRTGKAPLRGSSLLHARPFMRRYIFRSGQLVVGCFIASLLFASLLPMLAVTASIGSILAILHTVLLIFMQQWLDGLAAREELDKKRKRR